jgi:DNA transformation protein
VAKDQVAKEKTTRKKTDGPDLKGLRAMPSLGKASAELLVDAGITTPAILRKVGAIEAWRRLRFAHGKRVTVTWIYALDIAIQGVHWKELSEARARKLSAAALAIKAEIDPPKGNRPPPPRRNIKG